MLRLLLIAAIASSVGKAALGAEFEVDRGFGDDGIARVPRAVHAQNTPMWGKFFGTATSRDERVIVASAVDGWAAGTTVLTSFTRDGRTDRSFGVEGEASIGIAGDRFFGGVARLADGKLLVAGVRPMNLYFSDPLICRFTHDGRPDETWGGEGCRVIEDPDSNTFLTSQLRVRNDGTILAAGARGVKATWRTAVLALAPDGSLDNSFGTGGEALPLHVPAGPDLMTNDVALAPDGKLLITTKGAPASIARIDSSGQADETFATGGLFVVPPRFEARSVDVVLRRPNGSYVVSVARNASHILLGLDATGAIDASFGTAGAVEVAEHVSAMTNLPDGGILAVTSSADSPCVDLTACVARFLVLSADGHFDESVGYQIIPGLLDAQTLVANGVGAWVVGGLAAYDPNTFLGSLALVKIRQTSPGVAVEYYDSSLDHYFVSANPVEIEDLDMGIHAGWSRTGLFIPIVPSESAKYPGIAPACRFYIPPEKGDSHFMSVSEPECDSVAMKVITDPNYAGYVYETRSAFYSYLPDSAGGACPFAATPVFRLWNNRVDSNHRYTTSLAVRDQMIANGSVPEGYGPLGVVMCTPR